MQSFGKLAATIAAVASLTLAQAFAATVAIQEIDQVPFANGATMDLATIKTITAAVVDAPGTHVKMDLLDPSGKVLVETFASHNFMTADPVALPAAGIPGVTRNLNMGGVNLASGNYIIRARVSDCSQIKMANLQCLDTTQTFRINHRRNSR